MSLESITLTPDSLEALLAATTYYAEFLRSHLHDDGAKPDFLKMPEELRHVFDRRIDLCEQLKRTFDGLHVDRMIELAFSHAAKEPQNPEQVAELLKNAPVPKRAPRGKKPKPNKTPT